MKASQFFVDLYTSYQSEIDDHSTDSEGKDVLRARLKEKRAQFNDLIPMITFAPEMVALALHRGFSFIQPRLFDHLIAQEPDDFASWGELAQGLEIQPWAQGMVDKVLEEEGGELFLLLTAGLEYLHSKPSGSFARQSDAANDGEKDARDDQDDQDGGDQDREPHNSDDLDDLDDEAVDQEQAGADWLAEQGFDRKD